MILSELLYGAEVLKWDADPSSEIGGIASDSRKIKEGYAFVALRGTRYDGNEFAADAARRGAAVIVTDRPGERGIPSVLVKNARSAEAFMWNNAAGDPTRGMTVIAVTGTNGKTSTCFMLKEIFAAAGRAAGVITTVGSFICGRPVATGGGSSVSDADAAMTTPDPEIFYPAAAQMRDAGADALIFEASSHALDQRKLDPLRPDVAVFTNLTEEHLDYHGTMENYFLAKARLAQRAGTLVINASDPYLARLPDMFREKKAVRCFPAGDPGQGTDTVSALRRELLGVDGVRYLYYSGRAVFPVCSPIPGAFTISNTLLAAAAALETGAEAGTVQRALMRMRGVPGRLEKIDVDAPFTVFVDYAHTPAALEELLRTVRSFRVKGQRITVLFGCGGDRDRSKRRRMGAIASSLADFTVVTSDNSRTEDPGSIIAEIVSGIDREKPYAVIPDRRDAIEYALSVAGCDDIVVLAGKGHEKYEINAGGKRPFDETEIVKRALARRADQ